MLRYLCDSRPQVPDHWYPRERLWLPCCTGALLQCLAGALCRARPSWALRSRRCSRGMGGCFAAGAAAGAGSRASSGCA